MLLQAKQIKSFHSHSRLEKIPKQNTIDTEKCKQKLSNQINFSTSINIDTNTTHMVNFVVLLSK